MNRTTHLRVDGRAPARALAAAWVLALTGCGGSVYSLGNLPGDGGKDTGSATGQAPAQSSGGPTTGNDAGTSTGFSFPDGGSSTVGALDAGIDEGTSVDEGCGPSSMACSGGATGYACQGDLNPGDLDPGLSCSSGQFDGATTDYCCFPWTGTSATCAPDPDFPCDDNSYPYQCVPGNLPSSIDPKLSCGSNFVDSNGNNDFCCTFQ